MEGMVFVLQNRSMKVGLSDLLLLRLPQYFSQPPKSLF
jgi:hypothetical protein